MVSDEQIDRMAIRAVLESFGNLPHGDPEKHKRDVLRYWRTRDDVRAYWRCVVRVVLDEAALAGVVLEATDGDEVVRLAAAVLRQGPPMDPTP